LLFYPPLVIDAETLAGALVRVEQAVLEVLTDQG
jgi:hypothetical protein